MTKGLISCVIPTFNRGDRLIKRIEEIQKQSYSNWEIIIVNDGSTDNTIEKLAGYGNIKRVDLAQNSGCCSIPRNIGISYSSGEFIAPCDDDVIIKPNKLSVLVKALNDNPKAVLSYGDRQDYFENKNEYISRQNRRWNPNYLDNPVDNGQFIYRANVYKNMDFVYSWNADDFHLAKKLYQLGSFVYVPEIVSIYIWHKTNRSLNKPSEDKIKELNKNISKRVEEFKKYLNPDYRRTL